MPPEKRERERESESLHFLVKRLEDGQNHIVHGFKKKAYGQYEKKKKKRNVLLKAEKNKPAYKHNQLDVRWSSNRKEAAIERDGIWSKWYSSVSKITDSCIMGHQNRLQSACG